MRRIETPSPSQVTCERTVRLSGSLVGGHCRFAYTRLNSPGDLPKPGPPALEPSGTTSRWTSPSTHAGQPPRDRSAPAGCAMAGDAARQLRAGRAGRLPAGPRLEAADSQGPDAHRPGPEPGDAGQADRRGRRGGMAWRSSWPNRPGRGPRGARAGRRPEPDRPGPGGRRDHPARVSQRPPGDGPGHHADAPRWPAPSWPRGAWPASRGGGSTSGRRGTATQGRGPGRPRPSPGSASPPRASPATSPPRPSPPARSSAGSPGSRPRPGPTATGSSAELPDAFFNLTPMPSILAKDLVAVAGYRLVPLPFAEAYCLDRITQPASDEVRVDRASFASADIPAYTYGIDPAVPAAPCRTVSTRLLLIAYALDAARGDLPAPGDGLRRPRRPAGRPAAAPGPVAAVPLPPRDRAIHEAERAPADPRDARRRGQGRRRPRGAGLGDRGLLRLPPAPPAPPVRVLLPRDPPDRADRPRPGGRPRRPDRPGPPSATTSRTACSTSRARPSQTSPRAASRAKG